MNLVYVYHSKMVYTYKAIFGFKRKCQSMLFVWLGISESIYNVHMRVKAVKKYAKHTKLSQNYVAGEKSEHANICVNNFIVCSCKWTGVTFGRKKTRRQKERMCNFSSLSEFNVNILGIYAGKIHSKSEFVA